MKTIRSFVVSICFVTLSLFAVHCGGGSSDTPEDTGDPTGDENTDPGTTTTTDRVCTSGDSTDCDSDGTLHSCDDDDYDDGITSVKDSCDADKDGYVDIYCAQYADTNSDKLISDDERTSYGVNCDVCPDDYDPYQDDADQDGYGDACDGADADEDGYLVTQGDCDDEDATLNPGATDIAGDGIDQDCDGSDLAVTPDDDTGETTIPTDLDVTISITSLTDTASIGDSITVGYDITNNSDTTDFTVEVRIHDTTTSGAGTSKMIASARLNTKKTVLQAATIDLTKLSLGNSLLSFTSFCTDSNPCTTLLSEAVSVVPGVTQSGTATVTPAPTATGKYYVVVRVLDSTGVELYSRDTDIVEFK